jgi:putative hydrolase of the HAD superfamily
LEPETVIEAAVLDIGMVLLKFDFTRSLERMAGRCRISPAEIIPTLVEDDLLAAYEVGAIGTAQFSEQACSLIGFDGKPADFVEAWSDIFSLNEPMVARVRRWHAEGIPLFALSNTCESHVELFTRKFDVFRLFRGMALSCREGLVKPDPRIYQRVIERYRIRPDHSLFIDDLSENVRAAAEAGFRAIQYQGEEPLKAELKRMGCESLC